MIFNSRKSSVAPEDIVKGDSLCMSGVKFPVSCNVESFPQSQEPDGATGDLRMGKNKDGHNGLDSDSFGERVLSNGDMFVGLLRGNVPEGSGKYLWSDGCMYEGQWTNGKKSGKGKISWPSGATYEGDFMTGNIHGTGTFTGVNNSTYKGGWSMNEKTGFGIKSYANGDVYEGSWNQGLPDGNGKYLWKNGNEYNGEWKSGVMCGKGVLSWACGDKYEGDWLDGLEHGQGVYTWADGSVYVGTWCRGLKDGKGTFIPSLRNTSQGSISNIDELDESDYEDLNGDPDDTVIPPRRTTSEGVLSSLDVPDGSSDEGLDSPRPRSSWASDSDRLVERNCSISSTDKRTCSESSTCSDGLSFVSIDGYSEVNFLDQAPRPSAVVEREYVQGVLINELVKGTPMLYRSKQLKRWYRNQSKQPVRPGETIFKGHQSYELMINLQLGIRYTVGKITPEPQRELYPADFGPRARIWMHFPREGSQLTPPHQSVDFKWKDYCPMVFRHLRELFKIDTADYMLSVCGDSGLRELSSPGKSGSVFYLSHDDRYMIKTMRKSEVKALLTMLPNYYEHVRKYENTLVAKFFGLHRIKPAGGPKVRFIVMGNMFRTELQIHRRFDLKGSSQGRFADKQNMDEHTTLKDLDLDFVFRLEPSWRKVLLRQIECDCKFLESEGIMDYSLLLGLHFRAPLLPTEGETLDSKGLFLVAHEPQTDPVSSGAHVRGSPLKADTEGSEEIDLLLPGTARLRIQLGVNMPARADRFYHFGNGQALQELAGESYDVVLYFGIIDILQVYDIGKKLEHAYKSLQFDASSISAVDPCSYSRRFQDFLHQIFPES